MKKMFIAAILSAIIMEIPASGASITVTSPAAGVVWYIGSPSLIIWTSSDVAGPLAIRLYRSGDANADPVLNIASGISASGSLSWAIPASLPPDEYLIRVSAMSGNPLVYGNSGSFQIRALALVDFSRPIPKNLHVQADLVVRSVAIDPNPPRVHKDMIRITATVINKGSKATPMASSLSMEIDSVDASGQTFRGDRIVAIPNYTFNIPVLAPRQSIQIAKTITLNFIGRHRVAGNIFIEGFKNEDEYHLNNKYDYFFEAVKPPAPADLVMEEVTLASEGRLKLKLTNKGSAIPDADFNSSYIKIRINGEDVGSLKLKEIDPTGLLKKGNGMNWMPGAEVHLNYIVPGSRYHGIQLQPGQTKTIQVIVDYNVRITDSNRSNNKKTVTLGRPG